MSGSRPTQSGTEGADPTSTPSEDENRLTQRTPSSALMSAWMKPRRRVFQQAIPSRCTSLASGDAGHLEGWLASTEQALSLGPNSALA